MTKRSPFRYFKTSPEINFGGEEDIDRRAAFGPAMPPHGKRAAGERTTSAASRFSPFVAAGQHIRRRIPWNRPFRAGFFCPARGADRLALRLKQAIFHDVDKTAYHSRAF
jgi:hypothetical protein